MNFDHGKFYLPGEPCLFQRHSFHWWGRNEICAAQQDRWQTRCTNVMDSVYQCDGIFFCFLLASTIFYQCDGNFFTIVMKEKYHYDGIVFPVPKCLFTNVQGCQCTNVPRPQKSHFLKENCRNRLKTWNHGAVRQNNLNLNEKDRKSTNLGNQSVGRQNNLNLN